CARDIYGSGFDYW
nr:immunoglobulin heavy chain junction region [Macaca mulatta]MOV91357.1 immunoglobulin heavy chain junction region [Macaca mulatta]